MSLTASLESTAAAILPAQAPGRIPGSKAMWVGIFCELTEFALLFAVYFVARAHNPEAFAAGPARLSLFAGTGYTLMLLTSGWCVARAVHAMRRGERGTTLRWLAAAFVFGLGYPAIKIFELQRNFALGLDGDAGVFIVTYYYLTFTHLVHVFWGLLGLLWVMARTGMGAYSADEYGGLESFACYWHVTDMLWLMIFPMFYLLG